MTEHDKSAKRLGLAAIAMASLAAPVVIPEEAVAASHGGAMAAPQAGGPQNTIIYGADSKAHNQTIVLGNDGKPQNNRFVIGRDGKYHDATAGNIVAPTDAHVPGNNHTGYRRTEDK